MADKVVRSADSGRHLDRAVNVTEL